MTSHPGAIIRSIPGGEVSIVYHGTLLDVDGVGDVLVTAVNAVVGLISLVPWVSTEEMLDQTCVQTFFSPLVIITS